MKVKKLISSICAAAVSMSLLAGVVSAEYKTFDKTVAGVPVYGSLSLSSYQTVAVASIGDNPANNNYQVRISLNYTVVNDNGFRDTLNKSSRWIDSGGAGIQGIIPSNERNTSWIVSSKSTHSYNIKGESTNYHLYINKENT